MGLLKSLLKGMAEAKLTKTRFVPDSRKTEYENWLDYIAAGGKSEEWCEFLKNNNFTFAVDKVAIFEAYQKEIKPIWDKYYSLMQKINDNWSALYNLGNYTGPLAKKLESQCIEDIQLYMKMLEIDFKYGENTPVNVPAFKRLAMLYEKQHNFESAIEVCKHACLLGIDEKGRMARMIKKAGRDMTPEEMAIINS